jgi:hypothetical protein
MEYDMFSFAVQGAYDPTRYIWYTVVSIKVLTIKGGRAPPEYDELDNPLVPERYYLSAVDAGTGLPLFHYQTRLNSIVYGMHADIDSSRLVGVALDVDTGRVIQNRNWEYKLLTLYVNTTIPNYPKIEPTYGDLKISSAGSQRYMSYSGATTILSKLDLFIFTQNEDANLAKDMPDRVYVVMIPTGQFIHAQNVDFKFLQLFANEEFGDVTGIGPRLEQSGDSVFYGQGIHNYVHLCRISKDPSADRAIVDLVPFNIYNPPLVVSTDVTGNYHLYPGVSASQHLENRSIIMHSSEVGPNLDRPYWWRTIAITEVNIRDQRSKYWCNETVVPTDAGGETFPCEGTIYRDIPFASLFNREPGIPLSLKAPVITYARFDIEAAEIIVDFSVSTLRGSNYIDRNFDGIPEGVNESNRQVGEFDCVRLFNDATVLKLGPYDYDEPNGAQSTFCRWVTASQLRISLPNILNITFGDSIFMRPDTLYTYPRNGQYSPAASGGRHVDKPENLEPPEILVTGSQNLDQCSGLTINIADSRKLGKQWDQLTWELKVPGPTEDPNPLDLSNSGSRRFDPLKLANLEVALQEATANAKKSLILENEILEGATAYTIKLTMTSRWELTSTRELRIVKVAFSAPTVQIIGQSPMNKKRTDGFSLQANGQKSTCDNDSMPLGFSWTSEPYLDFVLEQNADALVVDSFVLEPPPEGSTDQSKNYTFTVRCYVINPDREPTPEEEAYDSIIVQVTRSPISLVFSRESRQIQRSADSILVIDVRSSQDPDYPTPAGGTFKGTFRYWCLSPPPVRGKCFAGQPDSGELTNIQECRTDLGTPLVDGGKTFDMPLFDALDFCEYTRGVLMFTTEALLLGEYKFSVEAQAYDGRNDRGDLFISTTDDVIPSVVLEIFDPVPIYPTTRRIKIMGSEETTGQAASDYVERTYSWEIEKWERNILYDRYAAQDAEEAGLPYTVDERVWVADDTIGINNPNRFEWNPDLPYLIIKPDVLESGLRYRIKMLFTPSGFATVELTTAGSKPTGGSLSCDPVDATMDSTRKLVAPGWMASGSTEPLRYNFGYISLVEGGAGQIKLPFATDPLPIQEMEIQTLPQGEEENNYTLQLYVDVSTSDGTVTTVEITVKSFPPNNLTAARLDGEKAAAEANPAKVLAALDYLLSLEPTSEELQSTVLAILEANPGIPPTPAQHTQNAKLLLDMINNGGTGDLVLNALERLIINAINAGSFNEDDNGDGGALALLVFSAIGGLLPANTAESARRLAGGSKVIESAARRLAINHGSPRFGDFISSCPSPFCDKPALRCLVEKEAIATTLYICCDMSNSLEQCEDPPCWFEGDECPRSPQPPHIVSSERRAAALAARKRRRLSGLNNASSAIERRLLNRRKKPGEQEAARIESVENAESSLFIAAHDLVESDKLRKKRDLVIDLNRQMEFEKIIDPDQREAAVAKYQKNLSEWTAYLGESSRNTSQRITRLIVLRDLVAKEKIQGLLYNELPLKFRSSAFTLYVGRTTNMSNVFPAFLFPQRFQVPPNSPIVPTASNNVTGFSYIYVEYSYNFYSYSDSNPPSPESMIVTLVVLKATADDLNVRNIASPIRVFADMSLMSRALCLYWDRFYPGTPGGAWSPAGIRNDADGCITSHLSDIAVFMDGSVPEASPLVEASLSYDRKYILSKCVNCDTSPFAYNWSVLAVVGLTFFSCLVMICLGYVIDENKRKDMENNEILRRYQLDGNGITSPLNVSDPIAYEYAGESPIRLIMKTYWNMLKREHILVAPCFYHEMFSRPQRIQCLLACLFGLYAVNAIVQSNPGEMVFAHAWWSSLVPGVLSALLIYPIFVSLLMMFSLKPRPIKKKLIKRATNMKEIDYLRQERENLAQKTALMPPQGYQVGYAKHAAAKAKGLPGATTLFNMQTPLALPPLPTGETGGSLGVTGMANMPLAPPSSHANVMSGMLALPTLPGRTANMPLPPPPNYPPPPKNKASLMLPPTTFPKLGPVPSPAAPPSALPPLGPPPGPMSTSLSSTFGIQDVLHAALPSGGATPNSTVRLDSSMMQLQDGAPSRSGLSSREKKVLEFKERFKEGSSKAPMFGARTASRDTGSSSTEAYPAPSPPRNGSEVEASSLPPNVLIDDPQHSMMQDVSDKRPPSSAATPGTPLGGMPETPAEVFSPKQQQTPPDTPTMSDTGGGIGGFFPPSQPQSPAASTPLGSMMFSKPPPPVPQPPLGQGPMPLFARANAPGLLRPPIRSQQEIDLDLKALAPPPPSGMTPPIPSAKGVGQAERFMQRRDGAPLVPPPPPPPPAEFEYDSSGNITYQAFVRRIQYTYFERTYQETQKYELLEDREDVSIQTPGWVYDTMTIMPYLASTTFTVTAVFVVVLYGVKFLPWQEDLWLKGSYIGFAVVCAQLEIFRIIMLTLVNLRMYENRKKAKAGAFLPSAKSDNNAGRQLAPPPRLWNKAPPPKLPLGAKAYLTAPRNHPLNAKANLRGSQLGENYVGHMALAPPPPPPPPPKVHGAAIGPPPIASGAMAKLPPLGSPSDWTLEAPPRGRFGDTLRSRTPLGGGSEASSGQGSIRDRKPPTPPMLALPRPASSSSAAAPEMALPDNDNQEKESEFHEK